MIVPSRGSLPGGAEAVQRLFARAAQMSGGAEASGWVNPLTLTQTVLGHRWPTVQRQPPGQKGQVSDVDMALTDGLILAKSISENGEQF
jgi:hypothetical protein